MVLPHYKARTGELFERTSMPRSRSGNSFEYDQKCCKRKLFRLIQGYLAKNIKKPLFSENDERLKKSQITESKRKGDRTFWAHATLQFK